MTTNPHDDAPPPTGLQISPAEAEARRTASAALCAALRLGGAHPIPKPGTTHTPAVTIAIPQTGTGFFFLPVGDGPAPDPAAALHQALQQWGLDAQVSALDLAGTPALTVALASVGDAERLAGLVLERLPEPHAAAHRLREALAAAGIHADNLHVHAQGRIDIGDLEAEKATVLCQVLSGRSCKDLDLEGWQDVEQLAVRLAIDLQTLLSTPVNVVANPACTTCLSTRSHEVTLGTLTPGAARLLANAVETTNHPL